MRPDPYKQERSRRYLAKQRAKYGAPAAAAKEGEAAAVAPRQVERLPSNRDRYEQDTVASSEEEGDNYDVVRAQDLQDLVESLSRAGLPSEEGEAAGHPKSDHQQVEQSVCSLYERCTAIDLAKLSESVGDALPDPEEVQDLPPYLSTCIFVEASAPGGPLSPSDSPRQGSRSSLAESLKSRKMMQRQRDPKTAPPARASPGEPSCTKVPATKDRSGLESWLDDVL